MRLCLMGTRYLITPLPGFSGREIFVLKRKKIRTLVLKPEIITQ